jgi:hypothetical protein
LAVAWTVDHVRRYNVGLVGGKLQLAVLEKRNGFAKGKNPMSQRSLVRSI